MGRIFNTNAPAPSGGGRINRGHGATQPMSRQSTPTPEHHSAPIKKSALKRASDFSERFLLRPWAGNAANFLIHAGQNIGEAAALADPLVRKYANTATGASGQTRVRDVAAEAGKAALDLSTLATGGSTAAIGAAAKSTKAVGIGKTFLQGGKAALPYGLAQGGINALEGKQKLLSRDSAGKVAIGGATGFIAGGTLAVGGRILANALAKKAAGKLASKGGAVTDAAATASTYVPPPKAISSTQAKTSVIHAGGKTTTDQNKQLQTVIGNLRQGKQGQLKERGFITTVKESKNTPQGVKDIISGSYIPKTNESLVADARSLVGSNPQAAETLALNPRNAVDIEVGNQLMSHYSAIGNHQKVAEIGEALAQSGTELGQAIQAFSQYDNTTPQGAIRFAQASIAKHNALGKGVVKMTDGQIKSIYDAASAIQALPMGRERNIAAQQLIDEVNNLIPSSAADKAITVWKAGLLTSLRTHERNLVGNTIMAGAERAKDLPATLADKAMSLKTGKRTLTATNQGSLEGAKKGWQAALDVVRTGYDPEQAINKYDVRHVTWGQNPVEQGLKKYTDVVFRTLGAEDKVFWNSAYARALYDQAGAEAINAGARGDKAFIEKLVQTPSEQMILNATLDANVSTFKDKNVLSQVINEAKRAMSKNEWSKVGGEILAPFTGVPSSILGKFVDYSPIGFANGIRHAGQVTSGKVPALQRQAAQEIGRGTIGSGLFGLGAYLAKKGLLSGQAKDPAEARQWELEGKKANSVLINGSWHSLQSVGPQTLILLAGAKAQEEFGTGGGKSGVTYGSSIGKDFLGQSFLAGVQGPINAVTDPARYGQSYLKSQVSSLVPNIVKDVARSTDPLQRETNSVSDAVKASLPGARNTLLPRRDVLGNTIANDSAGAKAFIDIFNTSKGKSSPIIKELSRLSKAGQNATPSKISPKMTFGSGTHKVKIKLTPQELDTLESSVSSELQSKLNREVSSAHYRSLDDEDKAKKLRDIVDAVRKKYKRLHKPRP